MNANRTNHKDSYQRMLEREDICLRYAMNQPASKLTFSQLENKRRSEKVAENTAKFGNQTIGIHGGELPKFAHEKNSKSWWRYQQENKDDPLVQSAALLKQNQKFWAKNDLTLLADKSSTQVPPPDPLKTSDYRK